MAQRCIPWNCPSLSEEERLLLAVAKLAPRPEEIEYAAEVIRSDRLSWDCLLNLSMEHWVSPVLAHNLSRLDPLKKLLPRGVQPRLQATQFLAEQRRSVFARAVGHPLRTLVAEGIPVLLMKGVALAHTLYPPGTRLLNDVDLLVDKSDYARVADRLEQSGFRRCPSKNWSEQEQVENYHQMTFVCGSATAEPVVDLHWRMYPRGRRFSVENVSLFTRSRRVSVGGMSLHCCSPEDLFVHYATQLLNDSFGTSYLRLVDIHAIALSGLRWDLLHEVAREASAEVATYLALRIAEMLGAEIPPSVYARFDTVAYEQRLIAHFLTDPRFAFSTPHWSLLRGVLTPLTYNRFMDRIASLRSYFGASQHGRLHNYSSFVLSATLFATQAVSCEVGAHKMERYLSAPLYRRSRVPRRLPTDDN